MIERVISGGQTGADMGGLLAATRAGIPTGGWAPKGWLRETPNGHGEEQGDWLARFGLKECPESGYPARRTRNVKDCDAILLFGKNTSKGSIGLIRDCIKINCGPFFPGPIPELSPEEEAIYFLKRPLGS